MAYEPRPGDITLFKNEDKTNENQPDYTGKHISLDGQELRVACWLKEAKSTGKKFLSGNVSIPMKKDSSPEKAPQQSVEDDLPF